MRKKTHICFVNPNVGQILDSSKGVSGGAETQILLFARELVKKNIKVSVLTKLQSKTSFILSQGIHWYATPLRYLGGSNRYIIADWIHLVWLLHRLKPDVVSLKYPRHLLFLLSYLGTIIGFKTIFHGRANF